MSMQIETNKNKRKWRDRLLILLSMLSVFFFIAVLNNDDLYNKLFGDFEQDKNTVRVAETADIKKDIRYKRAGSISWKKISNQQIIFLGDSVFTGEDSSTKIKLDGGGEIELAENTMITFTTIDGVKIPEVVEGKVKVKGESVKLNIAGKITELKGNGNEYKIQKGQKKAEVVIAKEKPKAVVEIKPQQPKLFAKKSTQIYQYTDQLYDFYDRTDKGLNIRQYRQPIVELPVEIKWEILGDANHVFGEHYAGNAQVPMTKFESTDNHSVLSKVAVGDNHWKASFDQVKWTPDMHFSVQANALNITSPKFLNEQVDVLLLQNEVIVEQQIIAPDDLVAFVMERSADPRFPINNTRADYLTKKQIPFKYVNAGIYYYRLRGINAKNEITTYSPVTKVTVVQPPIPLAPRLAQEEIHIFPGQIATVDWQKVVNAKSYEFQIIDQNRTAIEQKNQTYNQYKWIGQKVGAYQALITSIDQWGRKSQKQSIAKIFVDPDLKPILAKKEEPKKQERKPAQEKIVTKNTNPADNYLNAQYPSSRVDIEGSGFSMFSTEQVDAGQSTPVALMIGARAHHWWDKNGAEGSIHTKAVGLNSPSSQINPLQVEARYLRRWKVPFNILSKNGNSQISWIAGFESYRNSGTTLYSPRYDLLKTGVSLEFPVQQRWDTGGELLYGQGADSSHKIEFSGHVNYYLKKNWSMGAGYRIHLFDAGSEASSPLGLPYREGYGEGFSVLRWHY